MIRAIVLAAGKGTRMKSARPKVLHELCGRPMLWYVLQALRSAGVGETLVVAGMELAGRIAEFGAAAVVQEDHAVGDLVHQVEIVGDHDGGELELILQAQHEVA